MNVINESISYLPASKNPLSSDVFVIQGEEATWFFDVGSNEEALALFQKTQGKKVIVISHFHPDHCANLSRIDLSNPKITLYVGENTFKYTKQGVIVKEDLWIEDGASFHIFPVPSSHAKGSLGLELDNTHAFLGDGTYSTQKAGKIVYNAQLLREEIRVLEGLAASNFYLSHEKHMGKEKEQVLKQLHRIYDMRDKNQAFIHFSQSLNGL